MASLSSNSNLYSPFSTRGTVTSAALARFCVLFFFFQISDDFLSSWQESFSMPVAKWVALLVITHRFRFTEAEYRARREVFERNISLDPVARISLAEKHSVPTTFIIPALEDLIRRPEPLLEREIANLSGEMVARLGVARERYLRQSARVFASETWLKRVAHDIVKQLWPTEDVLISA
jgi:hypothetical protein